MLHVSTIPYILTINCNTYTHSQLQHTPAASSKRHMVSVGSVLAALGMLLKSVAVTTRCTSACVCIVVCVYMYVYVCVCINVSMCWFVCVCVGGYSVYMQHNYNTRMPHTPSLSHTHTPHTHTPPTTPQPRRTCMSPSNSKSLACSTSSTTSTRCISSATHTSSNAPT